MFLWTKSLPFLSNTKEFMEFVKMSNVQKVSKQNDYYFYYYYYRGIVWAQKLILLLFGWPLEIIINDKFSLWPTEHRMAWNNLTKIRILKRCVIIAECRKGDRNKRQGQFERDVKKRKMWKVAFIPWTLSHISSSKAISIF